MDRRTPRTLLFALVVATTCSLVGCTSFRDLDSVELRTVDSGDPDVADVAVPDVGDAGDIGSDADAGDVGDIGSDASDVGTDADTGVDVGPCGPPVDWTSDADFGDFSRNFCDSVEPGVECNGYPELRCGISLNLQASPPEFIAACKSLGDFGSLGDGETCGNAVTDPEADTRCQLGLFCTPWPNVERREPRGNVCTRLCEIGDDRGCPDGSFCVQEFPELEGMGLCVPSCDPYDDASCPIGQVCAPDFAYPTRSRTPRFRCRPDANNPTVPPAALGEACSMGNSTSPYRYCAGDDICYQAGSNEENEQATCVRPCQSNADCAGLGDDAYCPECGEGPWELRYCQSNVQ